MKLVDWSVFSDTSTPEESFISNVEKLYKLFDTSKSKEYLSPYPLPAFVLKKLKYTRPNRRKRIIYYICKGLDKSGHFLSKDRAQLAKGILEEAREALYDRRPYLYKVNSQEYFHLRIESLIKSLCQKRTLEQDAKKIAVLMLDVNALKGTNDKLGHDKGNLIIKTIADLLKTLKREQRYKNIGITLDYGAHNGDEFNILIISESDFSNKDIQLKFERNLLKEMMRMDMSEITNISNVNRTSEELETITERFNKAQIDLSDPKNKFTLSTSIGTATLYETLSSIEIRSSDTFETVIGKIKTKLDSISEYRSLESKKEIKEIVNQNPLMNFLLESR